MAVLNPPEGSWNGCVEKIAVLVLMPRERERERERERVYLCVVVCFAGRLFC
jgi:hypothetical protein